MDDGRLPKRVMFGTIKNEVKKGRDEQKKEWVVCVESDVRSFKIQQNWKHAAQDAQGWTEIVTEWRAEVYDGVEEGGGREVQNTPGEEDRQIALEPSTNVTEQD